MGINIKSRQLDMTEGSIFLRIIAFSVPLILSSILQLLFNACDVVVVGRFAGDNSLAAVGSTSSLINLLVNLFLGLSVGTNVVAANFYGAKDHKNIQDTVHTAIVLSLYSGVILTLVGVVGARGILVLMQSPVEVRDLATLYLRVYFAGITATMIYNFGSALLRAKGDTQRPLFILLFAGIINVFLNLIFVICFKMDVAGVALATVLSQCFAAFLVILILLKEEDDFRLDFKKLSVNRPIFIRIIKIGVPAGLQGILFSFSNVIIQSSINTFGNSIVAANSAGSTIEGFVWTSMNGFAQGTLTFAGQNMGAGRTDRIKKVAFVSTAIVIFMGTVLGNIVVFFSPQILSLFSDNPEVIEIGRLRIRMVCTLYALCGMMDVMGALIRGIGHSILPMVVTLIGACGLRIVWIFTVFQIPAFHNLKMLLVSYPISWLCTWIALLICFVILYKKEFGQK